MAVKFTDFDLPDSIHLTADEGPCWVCSITRAYSPGVSDLLLWHWRLGHRSFRTVARQLGIKLPEKLPFCQGCVEGKLSRHPLQRAHRNTGIDPESPRPAYLLFSDATGPFRVQTRNGSRYLILFVDDYTRKLFPFLVRLLSEFLDVLKEMVARLEAEAGRDKVVAQLLTDNHKVHCSQVLDCFCKQKGIFQLYSPPYTQSLNPAETYIGIIITTARVMLIHAGAPESLAGEAIHYAAYTLNRVPAAFTSGHKIPEERWCNKALDRPSKNCKVWGCAAWPKKFPEDNLSKFEPKTSSLHIFVGIDERGRGYRLLSLPHYQLIFSAHAAFLENRFPCREQNPSGMLSSATEPIQLAREQHPGEIATPQVDSTRPQRISRPSEAFLRNLPDEDVPPEGKHDTTSFAEAVLAFGTVEQGLAAPKNHSQPP